MRVSVEVLVRDSEKNKFWLTSFGRPQECRNKTCFGKSKSIYQNSEFFTAFLQCRWGCLYSKTLFKSICSTPTPTLAQHCLIIQLKMSSMFPPAAPSSLPLPIRLRAPPVIPSLGDCFPCGSINLGKYVLWVLGLVVHRSTFWSF
jgi:hypothetical protein